MKYQIRNITLFCFLLMIELSFGQETRITKKNSSNDVLFLSIDRISNENKNLYDVDVEFVIIRVPYHDVESELYFRMNFETQWNMKSYDQSRKGFVFRFNELMEDSFKNYVEIKYKKVYADFELMNSKSKKLKSVDIIPKAMGSICKNPSVRKKIVYSSSVVGGQAPYKYEWSLITDQQDTRILKEGKVNSLLDIEGIEVISPLNYIISLKVQSNCGNTMLKKITLNCEEDKMTNGFNIMLDDKKDHNGQ